MKISVPKRGQSVVSVKGQTVIPKEIREALRIKEGSKLAWTLRDGRLSVLVLPDDTVEAVRGVLKGYGSFEEWLEERNEQRERERLQDEEEARRWRDTSSTPPR